MMEFQGPRFLGRRELLRGAVAAGAGLAGGIVTSCASQRPAPAHRSARISVPAPPVGEPLRFVHLTDMHVRPDGPAERGYAVTLDAIARIDPPPAFLVNGGDHIHDSLCTSRHQAARQWDKYDRAAAASAIRTYSVIGNHDVWGWGRPDVGEASWQYGKALALDRLRLARSYYSFDAGGWHFVCLDNIARRKEGMPYYGGLDAEQMSWLEDDLAATAGRPACVFSHIPLLAACVFFDGNCVRPDAWSVPDAWMHRNVRPLLLMLSRHNVRLLVSGHIHMLDRVEYLGMTFICDGSVCGYFWAGPYQECVEGFGLLDLWPDGSFRHQYVPSNWRAAVG